MIVPAVALLALALTTQGPRATVGKGAEWRVELDVVDSEQARADLEAYANALAETNANWARRQKQTPCCATCAGVEYEPPRVRGCSSCQVIVGAKQVLKKRRGTCVHIAALDAGLRLARGQDASVVVVHEETAAGEAIPYRYHALVQLGGRYYDPSEQIRVGERMCPYG